MTQYCLCGHKRAAHEHFSADGRFQWLSECRDCNCTRWHWDPFLEDSGDGNPRVSFDTGATAGDEE
jgi:hypothetical protein